MVLLGIISCYNRIKRDLSHGSFGGNNRLSIFPVVSQGRENADKKDKGEEI